MGPRVEWMKSSNCISTHYPITFPLDLFCVTLLTLKKVTPDNLRKLQSPSGWR